MLAKAQALVARDLPGAVLTYGKVLEADPENARALSALRNLTMAQRRQITEACEALVKIDAVPHALSLIQILRRAHPNDPQLAVFVARTHIITKTYDLAQSTLEPFLQTHSDNSAVQITYGTALAGLRDSERAIAILRPYYDAGILNPESINALAACLSFLGRIDESREILLASARKGDLSASGFYALTRHTDVSEEPDILDQMVGIFANDTSPTRDRELAAYALANAHERKQDYRTGFQFLQAANLLKPDNDIINFMSEIRETGSRTNSLVERIAPASSTRSGPRPVFIVGLPRSGTTLTEQILVRHSAVSTVGESQQLGKVFNAFTNNPSTDIDPDQIRRAYFDVLTDEQRNSEVVLDKMPTNAFLAGLALKAMPDAKVIHCRRHPMACGFSAFQIRFATGNTYAHRFDTIAEYYRLSESIVAHWSDRFPGRIQPVYYEALTEAPEHWIEQLADFCDLDLEDGFTDYQGSTAAIHTASVAQVRQRIYRGSSEKWKNYAEDLVPLMANLIEEIARYEVDLEQVIATQTGAPNPAAIANSSAA